MISDTPTVNLARSVAFAVTLVSGIAAAGSEHTVVCIIGSILLFLAGVMAGHWLE